jgi:hypothetical protein
MMMTHPQLDILTLEDIFNDCEPLIQTTMKAFVHKFGGRFDDLLADAGTTFMLAWNDRKGEIRGGHAEFLKGLRRWLWFQAIDDMRKRYQEKAKPDGFLEEVAGHEKGSWFFEFADSLSTDARLVAELVVSPPESYAKRAALKGNSDRNWRSSLRDYLREEMDWHNTRVSKAFEEITQSLKGS